MAILSLNVERGRTAGEVHLQQRNTGKGNIGIEMLGRIIRVFPQLNLAWLCMGDGAMTTLGGGDLNADYKQAYKGAMMQVEALNRIIKQLNH